MGELLRLSAAMQFMLRTVRWHAFSGSANPSCCHVVGAAACMVPLTRTYAAEAGASSSTSNPKLTLRENSSGKKEDIKSAATEVSSPASGGLFCDYWWPTVADRVHQRLAQ